METLFPIADPDAYYCDVVGYDRAQYNLKLRALREPDLRSGQPYRYYLIDFFFTLYFQGPLFWDGAQTFRGSEDEMARLAPFTLDRRREMKAAGMPHHPRIYRIAAVAAPPVYVIAGIARVYAYESPTPLSFNARDGQWFASWPIIFEEGLPGSE